MFEQVVFQHIPVLIQLALGSVEVKLLQTLQAAVLPQSKIAPQRVFRDAALLNNLAMGQSLTLEPQSFHPTLHSRMRMMKPFVFRRLAFVFRKSQEQHQGLLLETQSHPAATP